MKDNYIENKLKEFDEKFKFQGAEGVEIAANIFKDFIKQSLTDYHNHIVEKIDGLHKDEKEFIVELLKEHTGYSYTQAYNVAVDDCLQILEEIK